LRRSQKPIVIASRPSQLARIQAEMVGQALDRLHPGVTVQYRWIESSGDRHSAAMAGAAGVKGQFTGAIEAALLAGEADMAIHSLKDLPAEPTAQLTLAAIPQRADPRDCLVARSGAATIENLPSGATLGTSSPRRAAQIRRIRPDVRLQTLRGNIQTRLEKVTAAADGEAEATLLAHAGLSRCGLLDSATPLSPDTLLPAACQGALAVQCRADDHVTLTRSLPLNDPATATAVHAERQLVAALDADCHSPLAALLEPVEPPPSAKRREDPWFRLRARVMSPDGQQLVTADERSSSKQLRHLVKQVTEDLEEGGATRILAEAAEQPLGPDAPGSKANQTPPPQETET